METSEARELDAPHSRSRWERLRREQAFVLVWVICWMTVLLGFMGLSVDLGNWYLHIELAQRAVDAAALDGAPYLPEQFSPDAEQVAYKSLLANGITSSTAEDAEVSVNCENGTPCMRPVPGEPAQLQVQVKVTVPNFFLRFLGVANSITFSRTATATYRSSISLGNIDNVLGSEPPPPCGCNEWPFRWQDPAKATGNQNYWLQVAGSTENKVDGDRYSTKTCSGGSDPVVADNCSGGLNTEYNPNGYDYHVHVDPGGTAQYLAIDVYDPAFVLTTEQCPTSGGPGVYCSGDTVPEWPPTGGPPSTTFTVTDDASPSTPVDCDGGANGTAFPGFEDEALNPPTTAPWTSWFHKWVPICNAVAYNPATGADFTINVKSGAGDGENDFAIRAAALDSPSISNIDQDWTYNHITVGAGSRMVVWNNYNASSPTSFHLVRVLPSWAGQTVAWQLYNIGDGNSDGTLNITGSPDINTPTDFNASTCEWTPPGQPTNWQATSTGPGGGCEIDTNDDTFDGRVLSFAWHVPSSYTCDFSSPSGCWVMINLAIPGGAVDTTTWTLDSTGVPVKLINRGG